MNRLWTIFLLLSLFACTSEIELQQQDYQPKIVVDGYIESDGFANVYLTKSSPFLTEYDSASIRATFLNTATVILSCSNGDSEVLTLFRKNSFFPPFVYKSIRMKGIVGETYSLEIRTNGKVLTASTTIPVPPKVSHVRMETESDSTGSIKFDFLTDSVSIDHVFIRYRSLLADKDFHPAGVPIYKVNAPNSTVSLQVYRCDESNLYLTNTKKLPYYKWPKYQFSRKDTVLMRIGSVDTDAYRVLISLFADQTLKDNPFALNSAGIQSNIVGGIGRWTGIGMAPTVTYPVNSSFVLF